ncbi:MAG: Crp/Fnr family transcriptional regulator [Bacteroidetes bacterium]|nr:Crp/Fnr family transcriptional regulator [Bacteroidota bacterium]
MFRAASNHNKDMLYELMMYYSCELRKSEIRSRNIALMNVRERVAHSLLLMLNVSGENTEDGKLKLDLKISGTDLAKVAGTTPEEICRTMAAFKKLGLISVEKKSIFIRNREKLQGIIDKYSPEWKCCEKPY